MRTLHKLHKLIFIYILINFISLPIRAKC
ncbi:hypothetical protein SFB2_185G0, partial [Candidatus Arthromitus sp. SFB-2]